MPRYYLGRSSLSTQAAQRPGRAGGWKHRVGEGALLLESPRAWRDSHRLAVDEPAQAHLLRTYSTSALAFINTIHVRYVTDEPARGTPSKRGNKVPSCKATPINSLSPFRTLRHIRMLPLIMFRRRHTSEDVVTHSQYVCGFPCVCVCYTCNAMQSKHTR